MPKMSDAAAATGPPPEGLQVASKPTRPDLSRLAYQAQLILLIAALYVGLILLHVVPDISYFIAATLAAIGLLALAYAVDTRQTRRAVGGAIALMHVVWLAFALHFTEGLNSPLLPLVYVVVITYTIQRNAPQIGLVLGGALLAMLTRLLVAGTGNTTALLTVGGHAVLLTATSWALSRYMIPLYRAHDSAAGQAAEYQSKYQLIRESSEDALLILDPDWTIREVNPTATQILSNGNESVLTGKSLLDLLDANNPEWIEPYQEQLLNGQAVSHLPLTIIGQDGQHQSVLFSALPIFDDDQITAVQATLRDVTQLQELRAQIKHLEKFAAVRHVLAGTGHSLNNPLAIIRLGIQVPREVGKQPDWQEIIRQVDRCATMVRGLEIYAAGRHEGTSVTNLNEVLDQAVLLTNSQLMMTGVELAWDVLPNLPLVHAAPHSIQRCFINIITNAWEAMEDWPGPRKLTLEARRLAECVEISFRDTGPGIAPEEIPNVFKAAYTTKKGEDGMGLGLPTVYETVQEVGGRVVVSPNRREGGTLVKVILRLAPKAEIREYKHSTRRVTV